MRSGISQGTRAEPHPFLTVGRRVRIAAGPLKGMPGVLLKKKGSYRFVISIELIQRSVAIEVDARDMQIA